MATTVTNMTITSLSMGFAGGQIVSVTVQYVMSGPGTEQWTSSHTWNLTAAESSAAAATGFVSALVTKLAAVTGLVVATT